MKRMWKIWMDEEAVSPVIATILMVAITVVLAAVLYVMVMGMSGSDTDMAPVTRWEFETCDSASDYIELKLISSSRVVDLTEFKMVIEQGGVVLDTVDPLADPNGLGFATDAISGGESLIIDFPNAAALVDTLNTGATVDGTINIQPDQICTVKFYYDPTGAQMGELKMKAE